MIVTCDVFDLITPVIPLSHFLLLIRIRERSLDQASWLLVSRISIMLVYQFLQELSVTLTLDKLLKVYLGLYSLRLEYSSWYDVVDWVCCPWRG